jgi:hypothetical protein
MSEVLNSSGRLARLACSESARSGESTCACGWLRTWKREVQGM